MTIPTSFQLSKTTIAAIGLIGLAVYQATQGQYAQAAQSFLGALAALGLHTSILQSTSRPGA